MTLCMKQHLYRRKTTKNSDLRRKRVHKAVFMFRSSLVAVVVFVLVTVPGHYRARSLGKRTHKQAAHEAEEKLAVLNTVVVIVVASSSSAQ